MSKHLLEHNVLEIQEALGNFNKWLAGKKLKHDPTPDEAIQHYAENGGPENFNRKHPELINSPFILERERQEIICKLANSSL